MTFRRIIPGGLPAVLAAGIVLLAACGDDTRSPLAPDAPGPESNVPEDIAGSPLSALLAVEEKLTAADGAAGDRFGTVAISGDLALVGAPLDDDDGNASGSAYVFERVGGGWSEVVKLTSSDAEPGDRFGATVAISGDLALVGAFGDDHDGNGSGSAYVFDGAAGWSEVAKLTASDAAAGDLFGVSVAISGELAIVGASRNDDDGSDSGSAYVFDGAAGWSEVAKLTASDGAAEDEFGTSVGISGDLAVVGAPQDDDNGDVSGSAYVYNGAAGWGEVAKLTASDGAAMDFFGATVAINGDLALIGARDDDDNGDFSGSAYLFSGMAGWSEVAKLTASDGSPGDQFGKSVAISGDLALVGADGEADNGISAGSAYVFDGADGWSEVAKLTASDGAVEDFFGISVAISGDLALVGAFGDDDKGDLSGSAYAFELVPMPSPAGPLVELLHELSGEAFKAPGHRNAMLSVLADVEAAVVAGDVDEAIRKLRNLRRKVDGCGADADNNDWIVDCAAQLDVRDLIDDRIASLGG